MLRSASGRQRSRHEDTYNQRMRLQSLLSLDFWKGLARFERKYELWLALRCMIGVTLLVGVGTLLGVPQLGVVAAAGALNVCSFDGNEPYRMRTRRMLAASLFVGVGVFAGAACGANPVLSVLLATAWAFAAGMAVALGAPAVDAARISLVTLIVFTAQPQTVSGAGGLGLLAAAGGLLQTMLAAALWPVRRYAPERRVLSELYRELSRMAVSRSSVMESPPVTDQMNRARKVLSGLNSDHSIPSERFRSLLNQAERIRLSLLLLGRLRVRLQRETSERSGIVILAQSLKVGASALEEIAESLLQERPVASATGTREEVKRLSRELLDSGPALSPQVTAMLNDARVQLNALAEQLRAASDLANDTTPSGQVELVMRETEMPWKLRVSGTYATLWANLNLQSVACRHAIRLAVCVAAGTVLGLVADLPRSQWIPMTIVIVLQPDYSATFVRGLLRVAGTLAGLILATVLLFLLSDGTGFQIALIALLAFAVRFFAYVNYGVFATVVTALAVALIAFSRAEPGSAMIARLVNTAMGGAIAMTAYWFWPTRELCHTAETFAQMLDAYRQYFQALREGYKPSGLLIAAQLDRSRWAARRARSSLEAAVDRLSGEPGVAVDTVDLLQGVLASSHRLVHALMALEAGLSGSRPRDEAAFQQFGTYVERTLLLLSEALRGAAVAAGDLPDLREGHDALLRSDDPRSELNSVLAVETDRITNSLNTVAEQIFRFVGETEFSKPIVDSGMA